MVYRGGFRRLPLRLLLLMLTIVMLNHRVERTSGQSAVPIEERRCGQYKRAVYERVYTFSAFLYDAPEIQQVSDSCRGDRVGPFIVGGTPANPMEFPHAARLGNRNGTTNWFCGGSLISDRFVLTAAHCFYSRYGVVNVVRLGELDFNSNTDDARPADYEVSRVIPHPQYDDETSRYNDIGLVQLAVAVAFTRYVHPACLPNAQSSEEATFVAIGWGSTKFGTADSSRLLKVSLDRIAFDHCERTAGRSNTLREGIDARSQMCAGSNATRDTCSGDSGGPLLTHHEAYPCMYHVAGITSTSPGGCAIFNVPGIYTKVWPYMDWIRGLAWPGAAP